MHPHRQPPAKNLEHAMAVYRCNLVRPNNSIDSVEMIVCRDDAEAVRKGRELLAVRSELQGVEVWQQDRRIDLFRRRPY
jgi:hypothetical protein